MKYVDDQRGLAVGALLAIVLLSISTIAFVALSAWAIGERSTYKNKTAELVSDAVDENSTKVKAAMEEDFAEREKSPLTAFSGPEEYGSIKIIYPKTWSVYAVRGNDSDPLKIYMDKGFVQSVDAQGVTYALRVEVVDQSYADVLKTFTSQIENAQVKVSPYKLPQNPKIIGSRVEGVLEDQKKGVMVILPLRDKAIKVWTENDNGKVDFDTIVMKNLTFVP